MATRKTTRHLGAGARAGSAGRGGLMRRGETFLASQNAKPLPHFLLDEHRAGTVAGRQRAPESVIPHSLILLSKVL